MPPGEYRTPIPERVRRAVYSRAGGHCEGCHTRCRRLELHHTTYDLIDVTGYAKHIGEAIFGFETPEVLEALCRECHHHRHLDPNGEFWPDPKEMEVYWASYYDELEKDEPRLWRWLPTT